MESSVNFSNNTEEVLKQSLGELEERYITLKKEYDSLLLQRDFERGSKLNSCIISNIE